VESDPITLRVKSNLKSTEEQLRGSYYVVALRKPPDDWGLVAGDCIQNIRAALDHAVWAIVIKEKGAKFAEAHYRAIDFPIACSPERFSKSRLVNIGVPRPHIAVIEDAQPYIRSQANPRDDALWFLRTLSNVDKHRLIHVIALFTEHSAFTTLPALPGFETKLIHEGALHKGAEVVRYTAPRPRPHGEVQVELKVTVGIGVDATPETGIYSAIDGALGVMHERAVEIINAFDGLGKHRRRP